MADLGEGTVFAGHRIDGVAGRGGMGTVYRATHIALDHMVALKVIAADLADDDSFRERFKSESRIAVSLRHPNVVPIHNAGEEDGLLFVTMDLIDGPDLRKLLLRGGALEPQAAIAILEQIASALDIAHSRGLVHRDIKPGNILIEERAEADHAYLTDFGLTKRIDQASAATALTSTGAFVGTLDYVAPEQIRGEDLDARSDVYALGCVLYEMLGGQAPYADREEKVAKMYAHLQDEPQRLGGDRAIFNPVIDRALDKQREGRFPSAGDLARAAVAALGGDRVVEAERSVATGPAAPTELHDSVAADDETDPAGPTDPAATVASASARPPQDSTTEASSPAEPAADSAEQPPTVESEPPKRTGERRPEPAGVRAERATRLPVIAAMLAIAALVGVGVLLLGGGDDGGDVGGGAEEGEPVASVSEGGVPGGELPVGAAASAETVYAADRDGSRLLSGDAETFAGQNELPLAAAPEDAIFAAGSLWVTVPEADQVLRVPPDLGEPTPIQLAAGSTPGGLTAAGGSVFVADQGDGNVVRIDPADNSAETLELGAGRLFGVAVDGGELWVTDRDAGEVLRVDPASGAIDARVTVGQNPKGVGLTDDTAWVANADSGTVSVIDRDSGELAEEVRVGGQPRAVEVFDGRVWVSNGDAEGKELEQKRGWVSIFDAASREVLERRLLVGGSPEGLGVGAGRVWVATGPEGLIRAVDPG